MSETTNLKDSKALKVCYWFTNISYYLSWVSMAFFLLLLAVNMFTGMRTLKYIHLPVVVTYDNIDSNLPLDQSSSDAFMPVVGFQQLKLDVSNYDNMVQNMWIPLLLLIGMIYIIYLFRLFLKTVRENSPFVPENPQRLKRIGSLVTTAGPTVGILNYIYAKIYIHFINLPGATIEVENEVYPFVIFLGLMIIVIGHVFEIAVNMKLEQDLTV